MSRTKEKKTKRSRVDNPALKPNYNSKIRQEYLDYDYLDKLNKKELDWLNRFTEEYLGANFNHSGTKLHRSKEKRRELYNNNNSRNRCITSQSRAKGMLNMMGEESLTKYEKYQESLYFCEDDMVNYIDGKYSENVTKSSCFILFLALASLGFQKP